MREFFEQLDAILRPKADIDDGVRRDALLALHAVLSDNLGTPSGYLTSVQCVPPLLTAIAHSPANNLPFERLLLLRCFGADTDALLAPRAVSLRSLALGMAEECLERHFGAGRVLYDRLRLTPFADDELFHLARRYSRTLCPLTEGLYDILRRRNHQAREWTLRHRPMLVAARDEFARVYQERVERDWRGRWGSETAYSRVTPTDRLLGSLLFTAGEV
jgi:hypothetical protein